MCRTTRTHTHSSSYREAGKIFRALSCCGLVLETADPLKVVHRVVLKSCLACALRVIVTLEGELLTQCEIPSDLVFKWYIRVLLHSVDCVVTRVHFCLLTRDSWVRLQQPTGLLRSNCSPWEISLLFLSYHCHCNIFCFGLWSWFEEVQSSLLIADISVYSIFECWYAFVGMQLLNLATI